MGLLMEEATIMPVRLGWRVCTKGVVFLQNVRGEATLRKTCSCVRELAIVIEYKHLRERHLILSEKGLMREAS